MSDVQAMDAADAPKPQLDGVPLSMCAVVMPYPEFKFVFDSREPVSQENIEAALYSALDACNLGAVQFLFDYNHVSIADVRRTSLMHLCTMWSDTQRLGQYRGVRMMEYLLGKGLDLRSPLPNGQFVLEQLELNGVQEPIIFIQRFLNQPSE
jgi:hypothetical protein